MANHDTEHATVLGGGSLEPFIHHHSYGHAQSSINDYVRKERTYIDKIALPKKISNTNAPLQHANLM